MKGKINEFLSSMLRPLEKYEVLIPILYLDVNALEIKIGDVTIKKFDELALQDWGIPSDVFRETANKTMAIIPEKGNNQKLICDRARRKADFIIRILQVSLSTDLYTRDENLLFKQEEYSFYRKRDTPSSVMRQWPSRYEFPPLVIDERLEKHINNFLGNISDILEEKKYTLKLRKRFERALIWIGRSIEEKDPDIKIINLSTALETILTDKSDKKKGETLAYRMLLLNAHVKRPFIDPAKVLWIYELRSDIIHGSRIGIASNHEYSTMKFVTIETLRYSLELIHKLGLKDHKNFIKAIKSYNGSEKYLFSWDDVHNDRIEELIRFPELLKFLMDDLDINWADNAEILKSDDCKTIRISKEENSAEIKIDEKKEKASLKISYGIPHALKIKKENGKLNIYRKTTLDWLEEQGDKRSSEIKKCMEKDLAK
ncbi:MAG: HEPN domain-containing protein [Euryarchaeota archaeon]|nr:HEPN domain-containing protein [Euryarchaeota archaeon]